jgi:hypothetical protein
MTAEDISLQRQSAITDMIIKNIHTSKNYARVVTTIDNNTIEVLISVPEQSSDIISWVDETIKLVYNKYSGAAGWTSSLYAALAYRFNNSSVTISVLDTSGCGWTTTFNQTALAR